MIRDITKADAEKFALMGMYRADHAVVSRSGKAVEIEGEWWPVSQLRLGRETIYGRELFAARWLLADRGKRADGATAGRIATLATYANQRKIAL